MKSPKNSVNYYVQRTIRKGSSTRTVNVECLGTVEKVKERCGKMDPFEWMKQYVCKLTLEEKKTKQSVLIRLSPVKQIARQDSRSVNIGYFVLQKLYYALGLDKICFHIQDNSKAEFNLIDDPI